MVLSAIGYNYMPRRSLTYIKTIGQSADLKCDLATRTKPFLLLLLLGKTKNTPLKRIAEGFETDCPTEYIFIALWKLKSVLPTDINFFKKRRKQK